MTPFLIFDGMLELKFSVHSAHLSCMNIVSVFEIPEPSCFRSLITICDRVFAKVVIDNKIWLNPVCEPGTNDYIFLTISLNLVAFRSENRIKPFLPIAALGLTIHAIKLNNCLSNSKSLSDSKTF